MKNLLLPIIIALSAITANANAQVGINMTTPHAPLQFKNETVNRKIVLYETGNDNNQFYGFGVNPGILRYQADVTSTDHVFYAGTSATTSNELMRIKGTGNVGIGTSTPNSKLDLGTTFGSSVADVAGKKLAVYNATDGTDFYGLGISTGVLQFHAASTASEAPGMVLTSGDKVGIGTTTPKGQLTISGSGATSTPMLTLTNTNVAGNPTLNIYPGYTSTGTGLVEGNRYAVVFDQDPGVTSGANIALFDFHGEIRSNATSTLSDRRLKKDIKDLNEYGLKEVMELQPKRYVMKETNKPDVGLIAQELKAVVPEIVYGDEEKGLLSVDYSKLSLVLINAIKEQQNLIKGQQKTIEQLQADVETLKAKK